MEVCLYFPQNSWSINLPHNLHRERETRPTFPSTKAIQTHDPVVHVKSCNNLKQQMLRHTNSTAENFVIPSNQSIGTLIDYGAALPPFVRTYNNKNSYKTIRSTYW